MKYRWICIFFLYFERKSIFSKWKTLARPWSTMWYQYLSCNDL